MLNANKTWFGMNASSALTPFFFKLFLMEQGLFWAGLLSEMPDKTFPFLIIYSFPLLCFFNIYLPVNA